jgi:hypothetical protein
MVEIPVAKWLPYRHAVFVASIVVLQSRSKEGTVVVNEHLDGHG